MNYYKITNETEMHHGLKYKTGLNTDPIPFNPSGDCTTGGIYYARKDVLTFLDYGPWIRKVTFPKDAQVYKNPGKPEKWKADKVILGERTKITAKVIERLLSEGADPKARNSSALQWAAERGQTEIVKLLIPVSNPEADNSLALQWAAEGGCIEIVKLLIPVSDPKASNSSALRRAAEMGRIDIVKLLIPISDPKANNSIALQCAAENGHTDIVKLLTST